MTTIVKRIPKGSPLTIAEMDANFENLNSDKVDVVLPQATDMNAITKTGFYKTSSTATNRPAGASGAGNEFVLHQTIDTNTAHQVFFFRASNRFFTRIKDSGSWGAWVEGWTATSFAKQTTTSDTTTGSGLLVGAFGLGGDAIDGGSTNANSLINGSFVRYETTETAGTALNLPVLGGTGSTSRHWLVLTFGISNRRVQYATEVFGTGTTKGRTFTRILHDSTWAPWNYLWDTANLVKQTSTTDGTAGSLMLVGAFGLGLTTGINLSNIDSITIPTGIYNCVTATTGTKPSGLTSNMTVIVQSYDADQVTQLLTETTTGRMFYRTYNVSAWNTWRELWGSNNLVKQTSSTDTTVGSILTMGASNFGAFGLGGYSNVLPSNDLNALAITGWFRVLSTTSNRPHSGILDGSSIMNIQYDVDDSWQMVFPRDENVIYTRRQRAGVWGQWVPIGSGKVTLNSNSPTLVDQNYHINGNYTIDLPDITGLTAGKSITFTKALGSTPLIERSGTTELIVSDIGSDTSLTFDVNCEIVFVFNGTNWEI